MTRDKWDDIADRLESQGWSLIKQARKLREMAARKPIIKVDAMPLEPEVDRIMQRTIEKALERYNGDKTIH